REEDRVNLPRMRHERVEKARAQMEKEGIGAYLCFDAANLNFLTDTYTVRVAPLLARNVLFPRTGDPILYEWGYRWKRVRDELNPWLKGNVKPGWRLRFYLMRGLKPQAFLDDLKKVLSDHGVLKEPLAVDMPIITIDFADMLRNEGLNVIDGFPSLNRARFAKTPDEVECLRMTNAICDEILYEIQKAIRPGTRESDLAAIAGGLSLKHFCDGAVDPVVCSGPNTNPNMLGYSDRPIRPRDMVFVDLPGVRYRGYHSCYYRTFTCGRATERQKEIYAECRDLLYKGLAKIKAGNTTADICKAWPGPEHWGGESWQDVSDCAVGHGIGLDNQEAPSITPLFSMENPVTLEEGMVIALETFYGSRPGEEPRQGARLENVVVVRKDGYEMLTTWPDEEITECWI
ncbi:MAG: Xaa-Pro peptidase family protein, partial [Desulfobacterales bacterium]|nr:Xaa-Pro peptidase family protein [Desulfobacterales bacterium]